MKIALIIILIYSNNMFASDVTVNELKNKSPERVLYIGNSYLYYNDSLHNHVRRMLEESYGREFDTGNYKSVTISGSRTSHHNIDYPLNHKNLGAEKPFELVILQGGSGETNSKEERKIFAQEVEIMIDKIHKWDNLPLELRKNILLNFLDNASNIDYLVDYFEKYRLNLLKNTLNSFIKGVIKH